MPGSEHPPFMVEHRVFKAQPHNMAAPGAIGEFPVGKPGEPHHGRIRDQIAMVGFCLCHHSRFNMGELIQIQICFRTDFIPDSRLHRILLKAGAKHGQRIRNGQLFPILFLFRRPEEILRHVVLKNPAFTLVFCFDQNKKVLFIQDPELIAGLNLTGHRAFCIGRLLIQIEFLRTFGIQIHRAIALSRLIHGDFRHLRFWFFRNRIVGCRFF